MPVERHDPDPGLGGPVMFGPFRLDPATLTLWRDGELVPLQKLPTRILAHLAARPGQVVLRSELYEAFWPASRLGSEDRLNTSISAIRTALGDSARTPRYLATVPRRGYRFLGEVRAGGRAPDASGPVVWRSARATVGVAMVALAMGSLATAYVTGESELEGPPPSSADPEVQELYLRARALARSGSMEDLRASLAILERASRLDPSFAAVHGTLAEVGSMVAFFATQPELMHAAAGAALRTTALDPGSAEAAAAQGMVALYGERAFASAIEALEKARSARPGDPLVLLALADAYRRSGAWARAEKLYEEILDADPTRVDALADLAFSLERNRRWAEADRLYARALALEPQRGGLSSARALAQLRAGVSPSEVLAALRRADELGAVPPRYAILQAPELARSLGPLVDWSATDVNLITPSWRGLFQMNRAWLTGAAGRPADARRMYLDAAARLESETSSPASWNGIPSRHGWLGTTYAALGLRAKARSKVDDILERFPPGSDAVTGPHLRGLAAETLVALGEYGPALDLLEELVDIPSEITAARLRTDPVWAPMRAEPRFLRLLRDPGARRSQAGR